MEIACHIHAIPSADRTRHRDLTQRLRAATRARRELPDGFCYSLDPALPLPDLAAWIAFERLCCPFLTFQFVLSPQEPEILLRLTGPDGVKPFLLEEFPLSL